MSSFFLLTRRRLLSTWNTIARAARWEWGRNLFFAIGGLGLLAGLYAGFLRLLLYLKTVPMIGELLLWKLTAMLLLTTFAMTSISSLLTSLTTLFYSFDLRFLMKAPLDRRVIFLEKSLESAFFASWMIALILVPYMGALVKANGYPAGFFLVFLALTPAFMLLAAAFGTGFTLALMYLFPSARTRDAIWVVSSLAMTLLYGVLRLAQPEKLVRPDGLRLVAEYLHFLEAPTARWLPSWWLTSALQSAAAGRTEGIVYPAVLLIGCCIFVYSGLFFLSGRLYFDGYSGAQESAPRKRILVVAALPERFLSTLGRELPALFWKERTSFFRDVKHWSQILLVMGLVFVYLFSIHRLPLDSPDLKSLMSFLNIATAGFVLAALGLRFTYPAISLEGRSWWVIASAPVSPAKLMRQKALFSLVPMLALASILGAATNALLAADRFTSWVSLIALLGVAVALCAMGVGFGALFPLFHVENVHQIESSLGGFVYMASSFFYIGLTIAVLAWPMNMHFQARLGRAEAWNSGQAAACFLAWLAVTGAAAGVPWVLGRRSLERLEV